MCEQLVVEQVARATLLNLFSQDALSPYPHPLRHHSKAHQHKLMPK